MERDFQGDVPLLNKTENFAQQFYDLCFVMSLPVVIILSVSGMIVIKTGEIRHDMIILTAGLVLEGIAFLIYPMSMRVYALRTITVCWSGGSVVAGVVAGYLYFKETPTTMSLVGCMTVVIGIIISVM